MLPTSPGPTKIRLSDNIKAIFELDSRAAESSPHLFPLESPEALLKFSTATNTSDTYIWNDDNGNLIGYFSIVDEPKTKSCELLNICVDPKYQSEGYGSKMVLEAEKIARELGRNKVHLVTNVKNARAQKFYNSLGYNVVKENKDHFGDGESRFLFEKSI